MMVSVLLEYVDLLIFLAQHFLLCYEAIQSNIIHTAVASLIAKLSILVTMTMTHSHFQSDNLYCCTCSYVHYCSVHVL